MIDLDSEEITGKLAHIPIPAKKTFNF